MNEKVIFFDAGPIISLVMYRLIWILPELKKKFNGRFYITPAVRYELVDRPLSGKRFEFEALQVAKLIREGVLEVFEKVPQKKSRELSNLANSSFSVNNRSLEILQSGEMESVSSAVSVGADAVVIDERTLRLFIEKRASMKRYLKTRFRHNVSEDTAKIDQFASYFKGLTILRSIELVAVAYKMGLLDSYIIPQKDGRETLLDAVLWATRYNGCAVTEHEINEIKASLLKKSF